MSASSTRSIMNSIYVATVSTRHYSFEAYGTHRSDALAMLRKGLQTHAKQSLLPDTWVEETMADAAVRGVTFGAAYRDRELL